MNLPGDSFDVRLRFIPPRDGRKGAMVADVYDKDTDTLLGVFASVPSQRGVWREWIEYPEAGTIPDEAFSL